MICYYILFGRRNVGKRFKADKVGHLHYTFCQINDRYICLMKLFIDFGEFEPSPEDEYIESIQVK